MKVFSRKNYLLTAAIAMAVTGCNWDDRSSSKSKQPANQPLPTANAGVDSSAAEGSKVLLLGSGKSGDTAAPSLSYSWRQVSGPTVTLSDAKVPTPTFTAPQVNNTEVLVFELSVSNGAKSASDQVSISVTNLTTTSPGTVAPVPPTADAGVDSTAAEGSKVNLQGSGKSGDTAAPSVTYSWKQVSGPSVTLSDTKAPSPTFSAPQVNNTEVLVFELTVSNGAKSAINRIIKIFL
jgi:hypothetical protein